MNACLRGDHGGSPTAVVDDPVPTMFTDAERRRVPARCGTSHAVFLTGRQPYDPRRAQHRNPADEPPVRLRFFTTEGELPACGHGTVAALAALAERVPEDVANVNSTACLAAHLAGRDLTVDMGDALGHPATITATARPGATGPQILVGGIATVTHTR